MKKIQITATIIMNVDEDFSSEDIQRMVKAESCDVQNAFDEIYRDFESTDSDIALSVKEI